MTTHFRLGQQVLIYLPLSRDFEKFLSGEKITRQQSIPVVSFDNFSFPTEWNKSKASFAIFFKTQFVNLGTIICRNWSSGAVIFCCCMKNHHFNQDFCENFLLIFYWESSKWCQRHTKSKKLFRKNVSRMARNQLFSRTEIWELWGWKGALKWLKINCSTPITKSSRIVITQITD